jgi:hypothetical protein
MDKADLRKKFPRLTLFAGSARRAKAKMAKIPGSDRGCRRWIETRHATFGP